LSGLKITLCIHRRKNRKAPITCDIKIYKQRNLVERMFGRPKNRRRIATRFERCAHIAMSAICIAATVIFRVSVPNLSDTRSKETAGPISRA
jgi:transposase